MDMECMLDAMDVVRSEGFERGGFSPFIAPNTGCWAKQGRDGIQ